MFPETPSRWSRPGLWEELALATSAGVWWPELHGLHHVPESAWISALRRGEADALRGHEHQCLVCRAVEGSGEYDPTEPAALRTRNLGLSIEAFRARFGRTPGSLCPPDYRWDETLEADAERLGVTTIQGKAEQAASFVRVRRLLRRDPFPRTNGRRFYMPPRVAFEPRGDASPAGRLGAEAAHRRVRGAWSRLRPAVLSTHRVNYAHLDAAWSEAGRAALRDLLRRLAAEGAVFLTDAEVRGLAERGWSARPIGDRGVLVRRYGGGDEAVRFPAPAGVTGVIVREGRAADARVAIEDGDLVAHVGHGEYLFEWGRE
jgi:hypothetical protein